MAQFLYGRVCRLEVMLHDAAEESLVFDQHRIQFTITKSLKSEENTAEIIITNRVIDTYIRKRSIVKLYAGYALSGGEKLLFIGDVLYVNHIVDGPNKHTVLTCKEGVYALREPVSLSYGEGTALITILRDLAKKVQDVYTAFKISDPDMENIDLSNIDVEIGANDLVTNSGFSHVGDPVQILDSLCFALGLQWSIQNNKFHFVLRDGVTRQETVVLSSDSGLVGSIEPIEEDKKGAEPTIKGYKVQALLFPQILPGDPVSIEGSSKYGIFKVEEIEHSGDTHGDKWNSMMKVKEVKLGVSE